MTEDERQELTDAGIAADRLRTDPAFQRAVISMRAGLVEELVQAPPESPDTIRTLQARIWAIDALCGEIASAIMRGQSRAPKAVA